MGGAVAIALASLTMFAGAQVAACGGTSPPPPAYPAYTQHEAELFSDAVDPRVMGLSLDVAAVPAKNDPLLFERAQTGDLVVRGRIDSITTKGVGANVRFELGVRVAEVLVGKVPPGALLLEVSGTSPSFSMIRALGERASGRNAIVFGRRYLTELGEVALHFHAVPDDPATVAAVRFATSLDRVTPDGGAPQAPPRSK